MRRGYRDARMDVPYCPYCGAQDPGDPCWRCGAGRQVPTKVNTMDWDRLLALKEEIATPGRLKGRELREAREEYLNTLQVTAARFDVGHQVPQPTH
jgi:hypothetical protein